jgi:hypothetical protein
MWQQLSVALTVRERIMWVLGQRHDVQRLVRRHLERREQLWRLRDGVHGERNV